MGSRVRVPSAPQEEAEMLLLFFGFASWASITSKTRELTGLVYSYEKGCKSLQPFWVSICGKRSALAAKLLYRSLDIPHESTNTDFLVAFVEFLYGFE